MRWNQHRADQHHHPKNNSGNAPYLAFHGWYCGLVFWNPRSSPCWFSAPDAPLTDVPESIEIQCRVIFQLRSSSRNPPRVERRAWMITCETARSSVRATAQECPDLLNPTKQQNRQRSKKLQISVVVVLLRRPWDRLQILTAAQTHLLRCSLGQRPLRASSRVRASYLHLWRSPSFVAYPTVSSVLAGHGDFEENLPATVVGTE